MTPKIRGLKYGYCMKGIISAVPLTHLIVYKYIIKYLPYVFMYTYIHTCTYTYMLHIYTYNTPFRKQPL